MTLLLFVALQSCTTCYESDSNKDLIIFQRTEATSTVSSLLDEFEAPPVPLDNITMSIAEYVSWILYTIVSTFVMFVISYTFRKPLSLCCSRGCRGIRGFDLRLRLYRAHDEVDITLISRYNDETTFNLAIMEECNVLTISPLRSEVNSEQVCLGGEQYHDCVEV